MMGSPSAGADAAGTLVEALAALLPAGAGVALAWADDTGAGFELAWHQLDWTSTER